MEKIFKSILIINVLSISLLFILGIIFFDPNEIKEKVSINVLDIISIILVPVYFYNMYLLYKFKSLGKALYIPLNVLMILLFSLLEDINYPNLFVYFIDQLLVILIGVIFTFIYFTEIKLDCTALLGPNLFLLSAPFI